MGNNKYKLRYSQGFHNGKRHYISETIFPFTKLTNRKDEYGNFKTLSPTSIHRVHEIFSSMFNNAAR